MCCGWSAARFAGVQAALRNGLGGLREVEYDLMRSRPPGAQSQVTPAHAKTTRLM